MVEVITHTGPEIDALVSALEAKHDDFAETYATPTCCPGCLVDWDHWDIQKQHDWGNYSAYRFLRGDSYNYIREDEDDDQP